MVRLTSLYLRFTVFKQLKKIGFDFPVTNISDHITKWKHDIWYFIEKDNFIMVRRGRREIFLSKYEFLVVQSGNVYYKKFVITLPFGLPLLFLKRINDVVLLWFLRSHSIMTSTQCEEEIRRRVTKTGKERCRGIFVKLSEKHVQVGQMNNTAHTDCPKNISDHDCFC